MTALWIRLEIPYAEDAKIMKGILGYRTQDTNVSYIATYTEENCQHIPMTLDKILNWIKNKSMDISKSFTLIFPLDHRHNLAWMAKDQADNKKWNYTRHIPADEIPLPEYLVPFMSKNTGSMEDNLSEPEAVKLIMHLTKEASENYSTGMELLEAISNLRHALQVSWLHFGWETPYTVSTVKNLADVYLSPGNPDNKTEALFLLILLITAWEKKKPDFSRWDKESLKLIENIVTILERMGNKNLADRLTSLNKK